MSVCPSIHPCMHTYVYIFGVEALWRALWECHAQPHELSLRLINREPYPEAPIFLKQGSCPKEQYMFLPRSPECVEPPRLFDQAIVGTASGCSGALDSRGRWTSSHGHCSQLGFSRKDSGSSCLAVTVAHPVLLSGLASKVELSGIHRSPVL